MRLFRLARNPPQRLRIALAGLMLLFALNSIAHVTHRHEAAAGHSLHSLLCGYCASFDNMTPVPATQAPAGAPALTVATPALPPALVVDRFARTSAQPRAPPLS